MIDATGYERFLAEARASLAAGAGLDEVLAVLRRRGFSPVDSIRAVRALTGVSLAEGKEIVHVSPAWADTRERADELHRSLEEGLTD
ncbi:hypothetical protein AB0C38_26260 [Amycolatopsis sp. NPDC048633]|uniref:hypothetical protein n=1 Tax=Amycolatopsis sp. NPDC048633 TaxID=3157095 RepID=UPI003401195A